MIAKFRRQFSQVEAVQYDGTNAVEIAEWIKTEEFQVHPDSMIIFLYGMQHHLPLHYWLVRDPLRPSYLYILDHEGFTATYERI